ncbi:CPBP family intramembrane glutamic endopeptidase [Piscibacillus salipiscarius]|uniref:CPBP family intramembrane glutamic endopeptidase n=1 Tax=Piscibacillus salipiscarius TaxID=299480 RepID=A0ABW5QE93_9BACI|nr:CPBP family intramembrane glutamic endopeptidase [Piscibacillus salipiscarius]
MKKQTEIIMQLTKRELILNLYFSQIIFIVIAFLLSYILLNDITSLIHMFNWEIRELFIYGFLPGLLIVIIDLLLIKLLSEKHYDDGGINKRIFTSLSIPQIFLLALVVSFSEELLFRGVLQTSFGFIIASILFALVHFRYLNKPVLLVSVLILSFLIGYLFLLTNNLLVTITTHFTIDFLLGMYYRVYYSEVKPAWESR